MPHSIFRCYSHDRFVECGIRSLRSRYSKGRISTFCEKLQLSIDNSQIQEHLSDCAAVDDNNFAVHKAIPLTNHERCVFGEFFRTPESSSRGPEIVHLQKAIG